MHAVVIASDENDTTYVTTQRCLGEEQMPLVRHCLQTLPPILRGGPPARDQWHGQDAAAVLHNVASAQHLGRRAVEHGQGPE